MRKKAFILVVGIIIAAGALFTAVYDVIYKYNSSNTINLNAATVDVRGRGYFYAHGTKINGAETATLNFDAGTYLMVIEGQGHKGRGAPAACFAFYKADGGVNYGANRMTVQIGVAGGKGGASDGSCDGAGYTSAPSNFARPSGWTTENELIAIASGGGGIGVSYDSFMAQTGFTEEQVQKITDGTFKGWEGDWWDFYINTIGNTAGCSGSPATQTSDGIRMDVTSINSDGSRNCVFRKTSDAYAGGGGGGGYFNGGASGIYTSAHEDFSRLQVGAGGSCTPWCYPIYSSDAERGASRNGMSGLGIVTFFRIDPYDVTISGSQVNHGQVAELGYDYGGGRVYDINHIGLDDWRKPQDAILHSEWVGYDNGIRAGWVYSVSEDGKSWHGVGPEKVNSE
ncbi:MAG: hypothetical protein KIG16_01125 [Eubacteriales bacterium]|nr:hypothetical protein [Eubacteriales bacterium]